MIALCETLKTIRYYICIAKAHHRQCAVYTGKSTDILLITWTLRNDKIAEAITAGWAE